jgi:hypothetical protein
VQASISEEPGAGKPHAGICAGALSNRRPYRDIADFLLLAPAKSAFRAEVKFVFESGIE